MSIEGEKLNKWLSVIGAIFGIFGTIFGVWSFYATKETKQISYSSASQAIYSGTSSFDPRVRVGDVDVSNVDKLSETIVVIWNSGKKVFRPEDVRTPLKIRFGDGNPIYEYKLLETKSGIEDNFSLHSSDSSSAEAKELNVSFKIFDPNMAIKIAILHRGSGETLAIGGDLGPDVEVRGLGKNTILSFLSGIVVGAGVGFALIFTMTRSKFSTIKKAILIALIVAVFFTAATGEKLVVDVFSGRNPPLSVSIPSR